MIKLKKILEAKDYRDVSNKFKSVLDNLPDKAFTTKNIEKIIKKLREKRPDSAMAYAKDAFGWLMKEDIVDQAFLDAKPVNEDGHTDVASAKRKLKLSIEDAQQVLEKLESMESEDSLPSWWMNKVTLAADYLNTSRDYILNPDTEELDEKFNIRKSSCKQSDGDSGTHTLSYRTKKGKQRSACHTSKKQAQDQVKAIKGPRR